MTANTIEIYYIIDEFCKKKEEKDILIPTDLFFEVFLHLRF